MKLQFFADRFSLYKFDSEENIPFDIANYSMLKHGSDAVAKLFGYELADRFVESKSIEFNTPLVVIESAYSFTQNAASIMTKHFTDRLNIHLADMGKKPAKRLKINRIAAHTLDYGKLSAEERHKHVQSAFYSFDSVFAADKKMIFIDDVVITGSHQSKIEHMLISYGLSVEDAIFVNYGEYTGDGCPTIESYLNNNYIKSLASLTALIWSEENYKIIVRTLKFFLGEKDEDDVLSFLDTVPEAIVEEMYLHCLAEDYCDNPDYANNCALLYKAYKKLQQNILTN